MSVSGLKVWDRMEEPRKKIVSLTKISQSPGELYTDFWRRLSSAVQRATADLDIRKVWLEALAFVTINIHYFHVYVNFFKFADNTAKYCPRVMNDSTTLLSQEDSKLTYGQTEAFHSTKL